MYESNGSSESLPLNIHPLERSYLAQFWKSIEGLISMGSSTNDLTTTEALQCVSELQGKINVEVIKQFYQWAVSKSNAEVQQRLINEMQIASTKNLTKEDLQTRASFLSNVRFALRLSEEQFVNQFAPLTVNNCQNLRKHYLSILLKDKIISAPALAR